LRIGWSIIGLTGIASGHEAGGLMKMLAKTNS
jgi:hypothetical protein